MHKFSNDIEDKISDDASTNSTSEEIPANESEVSEEIPASEPEEDGEETGENDDLTSEPTPEEKLAELQDKYLRLAAEFDNFRKRTRREKAELIETAGESLLKNLLPVVDDFERGLDAIDKASDIESVKTGMRLIHNKLKDFMTAQGLSEVIASGEPFDADRHEAVTNIPAPTDDLKGKVVDVIQKGYALREKIIRYPKVVVGE